MSFIQHRYYSVSARITPCCNICTCSQLRSYHTARSHLHIGHSHLFGLYFVFVAKCSGNDLLVREGKTVLLPGANDARLALAEDEVLKVDVGGDLVAGGDQAQLPDDHARLQAK